ncbi:hypothetical protein QLX67_03740 [Balneolaceae bacterium ANBcel3]|nr:hypothetical protein [Balneolaceae bacterium ANBcel3]
MKKFRKAITWMLPAIAVVMLAGLILSRVISPSSGLRDPEVRITPYEADIYDGRYVEVCGVVESADFVPQIGGEPTFLNMGGVYPNQVFTVIIWGEYRDQWSLPPDERYLSRDICVVGTVYMHRGIPQIRVTRPEQIRAR